MEIFKSIAIGVISTLGMSVSMWAITRLNIANADMIRAIGSLITRKEKMSFRVGLLMHFTSGVIFSIPYTLVLGLLRLSSSFSSFVVGGVMGFVHGFVVSFMLVAFVAQAHPVAKYREPGLSVAGSHIVGHIVYGLLVGYLAFVFDVDYTFLFPRSEGLNIQPLPAP